MPTNPFPSKEAPNVLVPGFRVYMALECRDRARTSKSLSLCKLGRNAVADCLNRPQAAL